MINMPNGTIRASENLIKALMDAGVLYTDENGLHANNPGTYTLKEGDFEETPSARK